MRSILDIVFTVHNLMFSSEYIMLEVIMVISEIDKFLEVVIPSIISFSEHVHFCSAQNWKHDTRSILHFVNARGNDCICVLLNSADVIRSLLIYDRFVSNLNKHPILANWHILFVSLRSAHAYYGRPMLRILTWVVHT